MRFNHKTTPVHFFLSSDIRCHNISASLKSYNLKDLTPGTKYNITLVGVTRIGEGPKARVTINTLPEKPVNGTNTNLWFIGNKNCLVICLFVLFSNCSVAEFGIAAYFLPCLNIVHCCFDEV